MKSKMISEFREIEGVKYKRVDEEKNERIPVLVTTEGSGVFFGRIKNESEANNNPVVVQDCHMCVYWDRGVKGVLGLASRGPGDASKISGGGNTYRLHNVTAVATISEDAAKKWESKPWGQ